MIIKVKYIVVENVREKYNLRQLRLCGIKTEINFKNYFFNLLYLQDCCKLEIIRRMLFIRFDFCLFFRMLSVDGYAELMQVKLDKQMFVIEIRYMICSLDDFK